MLSWRFGRFSATGGIKALACFSLAEWCKIVIMQSTETEAGIDLGLVKKRSLVGVFSLISRSFVVQAISFAATFFLSIFLEPDAFGVFFLVSAFVNFFYYFSDVGLAAALVQKKEKVTEEDLRTTFTVQQSLVVLLLLILFLVSPFIRQNYRLDQPSLVLLYALGFSFFLSSLKTIPTIILERDLKFNLVIIPQILEALVFNLLVVFLAWRGLGVSAFTWAVLGRGLVGLIAMYIVSPWKVGFAFSRQSLSRLLKFGVPYQANTMIAVLKDDLMTIFLGGIIGVAGVGYLGWAKKWAELPLRFLMDNVAKVSFPAFSRMQDEPQSLKKAVEKVIFFLSFFTFPVLIGFSLIASDLVQIIPRYLKWQPALLPLYLYCFGGAWATISTSMTNLLNAIGLIKKTFKLMIMWLVLTWVLMPVFALKLGYNGVAMAAAIIAVSSLAAIYLARQEVKFDLVSPLGKPLLASILMGVLIYFFRYDFGDLRIFVGGRVLLGGISYFLISYLFLGQALIKDISWIYHEIRKRR